MGFSIAMCCTVCCFSDGYFVYFVKETDVNLVTDVADIFVTETDVNLVTDIADIFVTETDVFLVADIVIISGR